MSDIYLNEVVRAVREAFPQVDGLRAEFVPADDCTQVNQVEIHLDPALDAPRWLIAMEGQIFNRMGAVVAQYREEGLL